MLKTDYKGFGEFMEKIKTAGEEETRTLRQENILTQKKCTKFYTKWRYKDG